MLNGLLNGSQADTEKRIVEMMLADYSWEQVVYDLIASQGMDPWNLDLNLLSKSFLNYIKKIEELDFRIPAKYVIISSVILRMKSDNMRLLNIPSETDDQLIDSGEDLLDGQPPNPIGNIDLNFFSLNERRRPSRQVMVTDLISSLRKVLNSQDRKEMQLEAARSKIRINTDSVVDRINRVFGKINSLLNRMKKEEEIQFSKVVDKWERKEVVEHFLPIVYLDNQKKIQCRQNEFFEEIYIKKHDQSNLSGLKEGFVNLNFLDKEYKSGIQKKLNSNAVRKNKKVKPMKRKQKEK